MGEIASPLGLAARLRAGETVFNLWSTLPHPSLIQAAARAGFRSITCDFQHGLYTYEGFINCVAAAAAFELSVAVRVPFRDHSLASRLLDAGAGAVIMPMVNSAADAKTLVEATKFPPLGNRSWGPHTAATFSGLDRITYLHRANEFTLAIGMIETEGAVDHLESILSSGGIDGVFVGPNDLSVAMTRGRHLEETHPPVVAVFEKVLVLALRYNKVAGIFAANADLAREYAKRGFKFISLGTDLGFFRRAGENALARAKGEAPPADKSPY